MSNYNLPPLDSRLALIASMVPQGAVAADIGTDHGLLPVWLVKQGKCPRALACDINEKPLEKAKIQIARQGLTDKIETVLTNGLQGLQNTGANTIIIAGMGGELISAILEEGADFVRQKGITLLLQPMTRAEVLREYLSQNGFAITEEHGAAAGKYLYSVMKCEYTGQQQPNSLFYYHTGKLAESRRGESADYLRRALSILKKKTEGLAQSARENEREQLPAYRELVAQMESLLEDK